jgi:beta-lactamase superfamily II metal-dependent hydrolase
MPYTIEPEDLVFHILNVGFGDNILIEFPVDDEGKRYYGIVDCRSSGKTKEYLEKLMALRPGKANLKFICATHPHYDHISGIRPFLTDGRFRPEQFWDSGFRHNSQTYLRILESVYLEGIEMIRVSSGMERYFGNVQITALAPSMFLRNRYATYGVDMNNASIVLRIEHHGEEAVMMRSREYAGGKSLEAEREAGKSVVILAGDAEYDSWSHVTQEFPRLERTTSHEPLVKRMVNYLSCAAIKVAHHGSMHSSPLDVYEKMAPENAVISTKQEKSTKTIDGSQLTRGLFPHQSAVIALEECGAQILTTDGSHEESRGLPNAHPGSIIIALPPAGKPQLTKLQDASTETPEPPQTI